MITRAQMQRQLRNNGGVMTVKTIRKKYGIGSDLKDFVRKIIPNEIADVAVKAAPFVAPFNPGAAALMRGIGRFDQRGSLSDALKQGALTYAGGRGIGMLGGAQSPEGFLGRQKFSMEGFKEGPIGRLFQSPTTDSKFKKPNIKDVSEETTGLKGFTKKVIKKLPEGVAAQLAAGTVTAGASLLASYFQGEFREQEPGETMEDYLVARKEAVGSQMRTYMDNYFKFDKDYSTMTDSQKDAFVARYNVRDGGRIGFSNGGEKPSGVEAILGGDASDNMKVFQIKKLLEEGVDAADIAKILKIDLEVVTDVVNVMPKDNAAKINELVEKGMTMDEAIQKIAPGTKSSVEFTREELGLGPLKINQEIDKLLKEGVDIEIIKSMTGATDELIQERIKIVRFSPSNEVFEDASDRRMFKDAPRKLTLGVLGLKDAPRKLTLEEQIIQKIREKSKPKKAKGGLMSIPVRTNSEGTKELDMRKSGGFVPIGVKEKADDVPAMLSKNEFVMTADAVRAAGGGSINKGAQRMYDTMKKLESRVA